MNRFNRGFSAGATSGAISGSGAGAASTTAGRSNQRASVLMAMALSIRNAIDRREDGRAGRGGGEPACRIDEAALERRPGQEADRVAGRLQLQVAGEARGA